MSEIGLAPLTEPELRRSLVNATRSEAAAMTLRQPLAEVDWADLVYFGWRDPKAPLRGYLFWPHGGTTTGLLLRAAEGRMSVRRSAMCLLCQSFASACDVALFTTRKTGKAGRDGNTVGTYICANLDCSTQLRRPRPGQRKDVDPELLAAEIADGLRQRLDTFYASVIA